MLNIENIQQLFSEGKKYLELQTEYTKLEVTERASKLLFTLLVVAMASILGIGALFYLSLSLAFILAPEVGGLAVSFALIAGGYLLLGIVAVALRKPLILIPTYKLVAGLMPASTPNTPEGIAWQKEERLKQARHQKRQVVEMAKGLFPPLTPVPAQSNGLLSMFGWSTAVVDGALLGWKVIKKVRRFFGRR